MYLPIAIGLIILGSTFVGAFVPNFLKGDLNFGAQPALVTTQGGTGTTSPSGILFGDNTPRLKTVIIGSNISFSTTTGILSASASGGGSFPFTPAVYGTQAVNSTTTGMWLTSAAAPLGLIASSTFATYASSTQLSVSGNTYLPSLTSALVLAGSAGLLAEYTGIDCTNQFVRDVDAAGAGTCATVGTADVSGLSIANDTDLTAGDALTLTASDIDFDGGASPGGSLGGTWASPTIDDLFILNTGDFGTGHYNFPSLLSTSASSTNATSTNFDITGLLTFNGVTGNSWDDYCVTITGSSELCDGDDGGGAGGGDFPFTATTNFGLTVNATTTPLWLQGSPFSLFASTTLVADSLWTPQITPATTTSMNIDFASSSQRILIGTSAMTLTFVNGRPGATLNLDVCNSDSTSSTVTFSNGYFAATNGVAPAHTTTARKCDSYYFKYTNGTTTPLYLLQGMTASW